MHRWIDNFDAVTTGGIAEDAMPSPDTFLSVEDLARLDALMLNPDDFIELTIIGDDVVESMILFADGSIVRDAGGLGSAPAWLAGSRIIAPLTAVSVGRFHSAAHSVLSGSDDELTIVGRIEAWEWNPPGVDTPTITCGFADVGIENQMVDTIVEIGSPDSGSTFDLIIGGWVLDGVKLPSGASGAFVSDTYEITLPAAAKYRLSFKGIAFISLEISDFSEYTITP